MVNAIKEAYKNGNKGVVINTWLVGLVTTLMVTLLGFLFNEGYKDVRGDIARGTGIAQQALDLGKDNRRDINVLYGGVKDVSGECRRLREEMYQRLINADQK